MIHRRWVSASALLVVAACAAPLPGWRIKAERTIDCEEHRRIVVRDAHGELREVDHPRELDGAAWDQVEEGHYRITRGEGGWWLTELGTLDLEFGQRRGRLTWLADGASPPIEVARDRYAGVLSVGGETLAIRGECPLSMRDPYSGFYTIIERVTVDGEGWKRTELRRVGGLCPFHAIADDEGQLLVLGLVYDAREDVLELYRIPAEGPPRTLGRLPAELPWTVGVQADWSRPGSLLLTQGWVNHDPARWDGWQPPRGRLLELGGDDDEPLRSSYVVRRCALGDYRPAWTPSPPRTPERELGIHILEGKDGELAWVSLLPDYPDLRTVVDHIRARGEPVVLEIRGVDLRGEAEALLRLPTGSQLQQVESLSADEERRLRAERPDLFRR